MTQSTIVLAAPTAPELALIREHLALRFAAHEDGTLTAGRTTLRFHVSGPGMPLVCLRLGGALQAWQPDFLIHLGIAGGTGPHQTIGQVVQVVEETMSDVGAEDRDGSFLDMFSLGLWEPDIAPFQKGKLVNPYRWSRPEVPAASAITVHTIPGTAAAIAAMQGRSAFTVETMEGAGVFLAALEHHIPFCALRGISNPIAPRNRDAWDIPLALRAVTDAAMLLLEEILPSA